MFVCSHGVLNSRPLETVELKVKVMQQKHLVYKVIVQWQHIRFNAGIVSSNLGRARQKKNECEFIPRSRLYELMPRIGQALTQALLILTSPSKTKNYFEFHFTSRITQIKHILHCGPSIITIYISPIWLIMYIKF